MSNKLRTRGDEPVAFDMEGLLCVVPQEPEFAFIKTSVHIRGHKSGWEVLSGPVIYGIKLA
jgi:hypothetical protein